MIRDPEVLKEENDRYYILASSSYADDQTRVLNFGDTFAVFDRWGDTKQIGTKVQGIYHEGTRFLSDLEFRMNGQRPVLLSSTIRSENEIFSIDLTNPTIKLDNGLLIEKGVIHIGRSKFLQEGICYESIILHNYDVRPYTLNASFNFKSDFSDIFEVRGIKRKLRGEVLPPEISNDGHLKLAYIGLDHIKRTTWIRFEAGREWIEGSSIVYPIRLEPGERHEIRYTLQFQVGDNDFAPDNHLEAFRYIQKMRDEGKEKLAEITSGNEEFTNWINRSKFDLLSLLRHTPYGFYPYAGVPWYNTPFGRDGIITAMEALWIAPDIAKGVLLFLAANQAREHDAFRDAEPGKILHEARGGEMAALNEVPFRQYYGTIDATPLYISLAGQYYKRTADKETIKKIWESINLALHWIEAYGDIDKDGFVEYEQKQESGLFNQGWKDSHDCISHEDGRIAQPSIALCEVQGYVYEAYLQTAYLADMMGEPDKVRTYKTKAKNLKKRFNDVFWDKELGCYVLALDHEKNPCRVRSSNAGQCLFTGIVASNKAAKLVETMMQSDMFSGWGIRTLSSTSARYNPMSYHNGSVWPHDSAMVAAGMAKYGFVKESMRVMEGLFNASLFIDLKRMPELFCGFPWRPGEAPTSYPVACIPQAWSVASVFLLLQSCLQLTIDAPNKKLVFNDPHLPEYLDRVVVKNLQVPDGAFELEFNRHVWDVGIHTLSKPDDWQVVVYK
ncbi:MAG TPA: amylo-alpha-1,6-glucosidase [Ohtaekwangia sp.]|nr:amylo-alpha-1,6-glucosidase [Ohtaekwangia sp.]